MPVADYSYVAKHGWYTEWPRIRRVGRANLLMNMHGCWFHFGENYGIQPLGSYLKITGDFCEWEGRVVFGCDDASIMQNPLALQSQSNLWFANWDDLSDGYGRPAGYGGPWVEDRVEGGKHRSRTYSPATSNAWFIW